MKKPPPKKDTKSSDTKKSEGSKFNAQSMNKILDIGKELVSTGASLIDLHKEGEKTKQTQIKADADVAKAKEVTEQHRLRAVTNIAETLQKHASECNLHEREMLRLQTERDNSVSLNRQRERVLDKWLEDGEASKAQLADQYRALTNEKKE
jgi:hypothetical protein